MRRSYRTFGYRSDPREGFDRAPAPRPVVAPSDVPQQSLQEQVLATFGDKAKAGPDFRPTSVTMPVHEECETEEEATSAPSM